MSGRSAPRGLARFLRWAHGRVGRLACRPALAGVLALSTLLLLVPRSVRAEALASSDAPFAAGALDPSEAIAAPEAVGHVRWHRRISQTSGGFAGTLADGDTFGQAIAPLSDLDRDGAIEIAVGAPHDDDGGVNRGAIWVVSLDANGFVTSEAKVSSTHGGFAGELDDAGRFGWALASLGDLDGDRVTDLAVGNPDDDDGGNSRGAVWILFLNGDGSVREHQKISDLEGGFGGELEDFDRFGEALAALGDLDGDGRPELAVGAPFDADGGLERGAIWILSLDPDGSVASHQKISDTEGGFLGGLANSDYFGIALAPLGDLDDNGVPDLVAGAIGDEGLGPDHGAIWILFLAADGSVETFQKINDVEGGFSGTLEDLGGFGYSVAALGDVDCDGIPDLAVGEPQRDDGGIDRGAVWILFLDSGGGVRFHGRIGSASGGFTGSLQDLDQFGWGLGALGDLDGDGNVELAAGAPWTDDGGPARGAVWTLFLDGNGCYGVIFADDFESGGMAAWSGGAP